MSDNELDNSDFYPIFFFFTVGNYLTGYLSYLPYDQYEGFMRGLGRVLRKVCLSQLAQ